jgi:hypothetical protein
MTGSTRKFEVSACEIDTTSITSKLMSSILSHVQHIMIFSLHIFVSNYHNNTYSTQADILFTRSSAMHPIALQPSREMNAHDTLSADMATSVCSTSKNPNVLIEGMVGTEKSLNGGETNRHSSLKMTHAEALRDRLSLIHVDKHHVVVAVSKTHAEALRDRLSRIHIDERFVVEARGMRRADSARKDSPYIVDEGMQRTKVARKNSSAHPSDARAMLLKQLSIELTEGLQNYFTRRELKTKNQYYPPIPQSDSVGHEGIDGTTPEDFKHRENTNHIKYEHGDEFSGSSSDTKLPSLDDGLVNISNLCLEQPKSMGDNDIKKDRIKEYAVRPGALDA